MGKSALSKLQDADILDKEAAKVQKKDPASAQELKELARNKRKSAIKQMKRKPKPKRDRGVLRG